MDIKEILLKEQNNLEHEFEENIEKYFSLETLASSDQDDEFRTNAISAQLTATWLKKIIPEVDSLSDFCKKIEFFQEILEDKRYVLASTMSEIAYLSISLSSQKNITEQQLLDLAKLDENKIYFTKSRLKQMLDNPNKRSSILKGVYSEAALDASRTILKLKQDSEFKKLESKCGYQIDTRYCKKSTHKTDNLKEQFTYGKLVLEKLLSLKDILNNKSKRIK